MSGIINKWSKDCNCCNGEGIVYVGKKGEFELDCPKCVGFVNIMHAEMHALLNHRVKNDGTGVQIWLATDLNKRKLFTVETTREGI